MAANRILIVEDDTAIADTIALNLRYAGYEYRLFRDGLSAAQALWDDEAFDLALLDIMLPGLDGFELLPLMEKRNIPVIYMTAKTDSESEVRLLRQGAEDYLVKPFEVVTLLVRMEKVLQRTGRLNPIYHFRDFPYTGDGTIDRVPQLLEKAKERLKTAPNGDERIPADTSFHQPDMTGIQYSGGTIPDEVEGWAEVDGEKMNVSIRQMVPKSFPQDAMVWTELYSTPMGPSMEKVVDQETFKLSREEAQKISDDIVAGLGLEMVLDHMDAVIIEPGNWGQYRAQFLGKTPPEKPADMPGYHLYYTRQVAGQKVGWMEGNYRSGSSESDNPAEYTKWSWHTEFLELCISEEGKVIYFNWEEPYTDPVIENPDAQLMEFSDIRDIFGKMIFVVNQYYREIDAKNGFACNYELTVDRVELTLARVHTRENFMEGKLVPVWDFYGTSRAYTNDEEYKDLVWDGVHENEIHLTINAMDGTILDRALGY